VKVLIPRKRPFSFGDKAYAQIVIFFANLPAHDTIKPKTHENVTVNLLLSRGSRQTDHNFNRTQAAQNVLVPTQRNGRLAAWCGMNACGWTICNHVTSVLIAAAREAVGRNGFCNTTQQRQMKKRALAADSREQSHPWRQASRDRSAPRSQVH
jgi:hypothetical protein